MHRLSLDVKITNNVLAKLRIYSTNIGPANANIRRDLQITNANANISKFYGFVFVPTPILGIIAVAEESLFGLMHGSELLRAQLPYRGLIRRFGPVVGKGLSCGRRPA